MIRHLIKIVWNRKRANFLIAVEIFFSFLVLFAVMVQAVYYTDNYRNPLGFSYENVWNVGIDMKQSSDDYHSPEQVETVRQLYLAVREFDEVEAAAGAHTQLFSFGGSFGGLRLGEREIQYRRNEVTDDFDKVTGLTLARGRWFNKEDDGVNWRPRVINQRFAREIFGDEDPVGKRIPVGDGPEMRVIGVVTDFRHGGEFADSENVLFQRKNLNNQQERPPRNLLVKLRPGVTRAFEEKLATRLQAVAKDWSFEIKPVIELRDEAFQRRLIPIIVVGVIAAFLLIMVALGLTGVLWLNVTQRTKEIGLRRAKGATAGRIYQQILGELFVITSFGLLIGVAVVVQFPLLDVIGWISAKVYAWSIILSVVVIYLLITICGLYPSRLATKVQPAEALHYE
ncbi:MAG TPA: ABC transporter permease [Blastocatellia bacterium]